MKIDLVWQKVWDAEDQRYAEWVRDLVGESGIYVIRSSQTGAIKYVGESHSGKLYQTLTRHFQQWNDRHEVNAMGGRRGGPVYDRSRVDVAAVLCAPGEAVTLQYALIQELGPVDNIVTGDAGLDVSDGADEDGDEEIPF